MPMTAIGPPSPTAGLGQPERRLEAALGQRRQLAADRRQVGQAQQIANGDAQQLLAFPPAQAPAGVGVVVLHGLAGPGRVPVVGALRRQAVGVVERRQQPDVGDDGLRQRPGGVESATRAETNRRSEASRSASSGWASRSRVRTRRAWRGAAARSMTSTTSGALRTGRRWTSSRECPTRRTPRTRPVISLRQMARLRVAAAQINATVGDLAGNVERILAAIDAAEAAGADLVAFPELAITGYPPEDLLLRPAFVAEAQRALEKVAARTGQTVAVIGFPLAERDLYNAAAVCAGGSGPRRVPQVAPAQLRRLRRGPLLHPQRRPRLAVRRRRRPGGGVDLRGRLDARPGRSPPRRPAAPNWPSTSTPRRTTPAASPSGRRCCRTRAADHSVPILYVNLVGGQDELVFDGGSAIYDESGRAPGPGPAVRGGPPRRRPRRPPHVPQAAPRPPGPGQPPGAARGPHLRGPPAGRPARPGPHRGAARRRRPRCGRRCGSAPATTSRKNGFADVVIGLSGGIDSAVVAAVAADALGPEHVTGVLMPSRYSSDHSVTDAEELAANLGIRTLTIPIEAAHAAFLDLLAEPFAGAEPGLAGENLQARIRGTLLMSAVQQVRLDGADHRQQERDGHRLRHPLRRHGRRVRRPQGRREDARLPPRPVAEPRRRRHPARTSSRSRPRPSWPPARSTPTRSRPTTCSTRSSRDTLKVTGR